MLGTTTALVIAPRVLAEKDDVKMIPGTWTQIEEENIHPHRYFVSSDPATGHSQSAVTIDVSKIPDGFTLEDIVLIWENHGVIIIDSTKIR